MFLDFCNVMQRRFVLQDGPLTIGNDSLLPILTRYA